MDKKLKQLLDKPILTNEEMEELKQRDYCRMHSLDYDKMVSKCDRIFKKAEKTGESKYLRTDKQREKFEEEIYDGYGFNNPDFQYDMMREREMIDRLN